jgi:hypothetical protein
MIRMGSNLTIRQNQQDPKDELLMKNKLSYRNWKGRHWFAAALLGTLTWVSSRYYLRLRRQTPFKHRGLPAGVEDHETLIAQGIHIAEDDLRICIEPRDLLDGQILGMLTREDSISFLQTQVELGLGRNSKNHPGHQQR